MKPAGKLLPYRWEPFNLEAVNHGVNAAKVKYQADKVTAERERILGILSEELERLKQLGEVAAAAVLRGAIKLIEQDSLLDADVSI